MYLQLFSCIFSILLLYCDVSVALAPALQCKPKSGNIIKVDQKGGKFKTIQSAINSVPDGNSQWTHIQIAAGLYKEKIKIPISKQCIFLDGAGMKSTKIEWNDHGSTGGSVTFATLASNTLVRGIQFKNGFNRPPQLLQDDLAPALSAQIDGDKCAFFECAFIGLQDSLWDSHGKHYFKNCYIQGGVDFIFGTAESVFEGSTLYYAMGEYGVNRKKGYMTAQGRTSLSDPSAFVFKNCKFTGTGKAYLGRAWKAYSRVIISNSDLSAVVDPLGWNAWTFQGQESGKISYVETNNRGPGASTAGRVPWMKKTSPDLTKLLSNSYINADGWIAKLPLGTTPAPA